MIQIKPTMMRTMNDQVHQRKLVDCSDAASFRCLWRNEAGSEVSTNCRWWD